VAVAGAEQFAVDSLQFFLILQVNLSEIPVGQSNHLLHKAVLSLQSTDLNELIIL